MILSAHAESIILSALPAESIILSAPPEQQWETPAAQWVAGSEAMALGDGTAAAQWTAQCHRRGASDEVSFMYFRLGKRLICYIHSRSASRPSMLITNFIMVPILQK
jgi:hypothetical protein